MATRDQDTPDRNPASIGYQDQPSQPDAGLLPHSSVMHIIWRHRWGTLVVIALAVAAGLGYLVKATPIYTSSSRLYVERKGPEIITANEGFMTQAKNYLYTQCELLKSTPILSRVVKSLDHRTLAGLNADIDPVTYLKKNLDVEVGKKDDIITVALDSPDPNEAAEVVNAVVESYIAYHSMQKRDTAAEVLKILEREKVKRDQELEQRFRTLMDFKRTNGMISFGTDNSNIVIQRLIKISDALTQAEMDMLDARAEYQTTNALTKDPVRLYRLAEAQYTFGKQANASNQEMSVFRVDLDKLQLELTSLKAQCTADHPAVKVLEAKIRQLSTQRNHRLEQLADAYVAILSQKYQAATDRVAQLKASLDRQRTLAQQLNSKAVQYAMLENEFKRTERLCNILDNRIKEIDVNEDAGALNISILEVAQAEAIPSHPRKARIMALALLAGLFGGVGLSLFRNWADQRLRSSEEISQVLGLPVLGVVPHIVQPKDDDTIGKIVDIEPTCQAAEAYRTIRTALYFGVPNGRTKTVLVTSPAAGDGKSTLASNLAITMAQTDQKVLILDADFRKPSQQKTFKTDNEAIGLCGVLAGRNDLSEAIRRSSVKNLDVLPCGPIPPNPSEMLNSRAFAELLVELSQRYDHIVLDAPPVMPVTDARILGAICNVTVLVLRADKSNRRPSQQAVKDLMKVGTQILGVVVNDTPLNKNGYGYGYGYGYGDYYYGYGRRDENNPVQEREEGDTVRSNAA